MTERPPRARRRTRASEAYAVATVHLWGKQVGAVAESPDGRITFEYLDDFRAAGVEISPVHLPLQRRGPIEFPELRRSQAFAGLPGVLADALPDAFGNAIIRRYFEERQLPNAALSPVQRLLYIGARAMGALEFRPAMNRNTTAATDTALEVARLVDEARRVVAGDLSVEVPEMMQVGSSAGGARAKALIQWNRETNAVKSAFARGDASDEQWLIKFDGVTGGVGGHGITQEFRPAPYGRTEYAYSRMARAAQIDMTDTHLLRDRDFAHFMTRRFDRDGDRKVHLHSLGGLQHIDYNVPRAFSYEDYFRTIRELGMGQPSIAQAFRRMVFNIVARNQDDHVKNFSFLLDEGGAWRLSPAYDMTWANGNEWTRQHQMTANGKADDFTRADLLAVGDMFDLPAGGSALIDEVETAVRRWPAEAHDAGLEPEWTRSLESQFRKVS